MFGDTGDASPAAQAADYSDAELPTFWSEPCLAMWKKIRLGRGAHVQRGLVSLHLGGGERKKKPVLGGTRVLDGDRCGSGAESP